MGDIRNGKIAQEEESQAYYAGATDPGTGPLCFCSYWPPLFYFRSLFLLPSFFLPARPAKPHQNSRPPLPPQ